MKKTFLGISVWRWILAILIGLGSFGLRADFALRAPIDFDEPVYLNAALSYANYMRAGKWSWLAWHEENTEHPVLNKIFYGVVMLTQDPIEKLHDKDITRLAPIATAASRQWLIPARMSTAAAAGLAAAALALFNPLAGVFFGIQTYSIKYTAEVYLEGLPLFLSVLAFLAVSQWRRCQPGSRKAWAWWVGSAVLLGAAVACKYVYGVFALAVVAWELIHLFQNRSDALMIFKRVAAWGAGAAAGLFLFNPYLWPHPLHRFIDSLLFHLHYPSTNMVKLYNYPWWQPYRWLSAPIDVWQPDQLGLFHFHLDGWISLLAVIGLYFLMKKHPLAGLWFIIGLGVVFAWPTKWPQYTMIVMVPLCLAAAEGARVLFFDLPIWLWERFKKKNIVKTFHG